jgi:hypothetical protein
MLFSGGAGDWGVLYGAWEAGFVIRGAWCVRHRKCKVQSAKLWSRCAGFFRGS